MKKPAKKEDSKIVEQAWKKFAKKDFEGSEKLFSDVLEHDEENIEALHGLVGSLLRQKEYGKTIDLLDKWIELQPKVALPYHLRGLAYSGDESFDEAISDLLKAIELYDDKMEAYCDLAGTFLAMEDYKSAAQYYEKCIDIDGKCFEAWTGKALAAYFNKEHKAALEFFNIALKLNPKNLLALLAKADTLLESGKKADVEKELKKILAMSPDIFHQDFTKKDMDDDDDKDVDEDANRSEDDEIEEFDLDD